MKTAETRPRYQVYVLRLWREQAASAEHPAAWRFVLEDPKTRQRRGFADLQALMAFLGEIVSDGLARPTETEPPATPEIPTDTNHVFSTRKNHEP